MIDYKLGNESHSSYSSIDKKPLLSLTEQQEQVDQLALDVLRTTPDKISEHLNRTNAGVGHLIAQDNKEEPKTVDSAKTEERKQHKQKKQLEKADKVEKARIRAEETAPRYHLILPTSQSLRTKDEIMNVRFSQDSVAQGSRENEDLFEKIQTEGWQSGISMQVVRMPDGTLTSMNNRRLAAVQRIVAIAEDHFKKRPVKAAIYEHATVSHDVETISVEAISRGAIPVENSGLELQASTYGALIYYRMRLTDGGRGKIQSGNPYGFTDTPIVRKTDLPSVSRVPC